MLGGICTVLKLTMLKWTESSYLYNTTKLPIPHMIRYAAFYTLYEHLFQGTILEDSIKTTSSLRRPKRKNLKMPLLAILYMALTVHATNLSF